MKKTFISVSILILLVLVVFGPSWSKDTPAWWPSTIIEAQKDGYALITPEKSPKPVCFWQQLYYGGCPAGL